MNLLEINEILKGGKGSGDFGHIGRAGKRGGSGGGGGKGKPRKGRRSREALNKEIEARKKPKKKLDELKIRSVLPVIPPNATKFRFDGDDLMFDIGGRSHTMNDVRQLVESAPDKLTFTASKVTSDTKNRDKDTNIKKLNENFNAHDAGQKKPNATTVNNLAKKTGVDKQIIESYITDWNGDDKVARYKVSKSIQRTLGIELSPYEKKNEHRWKSDIPKDYDKITKAVYEDTQKQLKDLGSSEVLLHRGMMQKNIAISQGDTVKWHGNSLDSWSTDDFTAESFADAEGGFVIKSSIPANRIFSMSSSGPGTSGEREMTVLGNGPNDEVVVVFVNGF